MWIHSAFLFTFLFFASGMGPTRQGPDAGQGYPMPGLPGVSIAQGLNQNGDVQWVLVYQNGKQIQALDICVSGAVPRRDPLGSLAVADFNFDNSPDLALQVSSEDGNSKYCVWLFDPGQQLFMLNYQLSGVANLAPDPSTKTLQSYENQGCNGVCFTKNSYRWSNGEMELIRSESTSKAPLSLGYGGCDFVHSVKELKRGELREVSRERVNALGINCDLR